MISSACSDRGVKAYYWLQDILPYMPSDVLDYTLDDCAQAMCNGRVAIQLNISSFLFPQQFYNSNKSIIAEIVGATEIPGVGKYRGIGYGGGWSWTIPKTVKSTSASWIAAQYFSSKAFDKYRCIQYGVTPVRKSTVRDVEVQKTQPWVSCIEPVINKAVAPEYFCIPEAFQIIEIFNRELISGLASDNTAKINRLCSV